MKDLQIFKNSQFGEVRVTEQNGDVLFAANDVAKALGYSNPRDAVIRHCDSEDVVKHDTPTISGVQLMTYINESAMYALVFGSKLEQAKEFKRWVTSEVLPTIRKHGAYMSESVLEKTLTDPDFLIQLATNLKEERRQKELYQMQTEIQTKELKLAAPKVQYFNDVLQSASTYNINKIAKELGTSAITLNRRLHDMRIQYKQNDTWLLYEKYQNKGLTKTVTGTFTSSTSGEIHTTMQTVWTEKGRLFIHGMIKGMDNTDKN